MPRELEIETGGAAVFWQRGVPFCTKDDCPHYDGKRCEKLGVRPGNICEPTVQNMAERIENLTRLASLDRAVVEAAKALRDDDNSWPKGQALQAAVDERRKAND